MKKILRNTMEKANKGSFPQKGLKEHFICLSSNELGKKSVVSIAYSFCRQGTSNILRAIV